MLQVRHLKCADYQLQRWKNGKGETREIAVDADKPFRWRLSSALLSESGPFSPFPGYERILLLLSGGPVTLSHPEKRQKQLRPMEKYSFQGDWESNAIVEVPSKDFNVFLLKGQAQGAIYPQVAHNNNETQFALSAQEHFLFCVSGDMEILEPNTGQSLVLHSEDTLRLTRDEKKEFLNIRSRSLSPKAQFLWIPIHLI